MATYISFTDYLKAYTPPHLHSIIGNSDYGVAQRFIEALPKVYPPSHIIHFDNHPAQGDWVRIGQLFMSQGRNHEALAIFQLLYDNLFVAQEEYRNIINKPAHKGMALYFMGLCYQAMNFPVHAKRYMMLSLIEDAARDEGKVETTGVFFQLVWMFGLSESLVKDYANQAYQRSLESSLGDFYPERVLQEFDRKECNQRWMTELPSPGEALHWRINQRYYRLLLSQLGDGTGKTLQDLATYLLACMPGCRTITEADTPSTDLDVVCSIDGTDMDFRSELGRYFVAECKDWSAPVDFTTTAKFCRVLDSIKARFGILFSREGITGLKTKTYEHIAAAREILKVYQDRGIVIVVISRKDLDDIANGHDFINMLREKYTEVRLDLIRSKAEIERKYTERPTVNSQQLDADI